MTSSAPSDVTSASLRAWSTPVTCAPYALASWRAMAPTPPAAPLTSTRWPGGTRRCGRLFRAISPAVGTAAASSKLTSGGLSATPASGAVAYSAKAPPLRHCTPRMVSANTSSPARKRVTAAPTDSTIPATSVPGTRSFGRRMPEPIRRSAHGRPATTCQTSGCTEAARTRISTSSSAGAGRWTSRSLSASMAPYRSWTIALTLRNVLRARLSRRRGSACPRGRRRSGGAVGRRGRGSGPAGRRCGRGSGGRAPAGRCRPWRR